MNENSSNSLENVAKWLEKQGYPLEILVARQFHQADFYVKISDFYMDFETEKPREIDVTAQYHSEIFDPVLLQVSFHIECKSSPDKPWIMFVSDTSRGEIGFGFEKFVPSSIYRTFLLAMLDSEYSDKFYPRFNKCPLLMPQNIHYGITQAFTNGQDIPYAAVMSALKSSIHRIKTFDGFSEIGGMKHQCAAAFPVVILDGTLLESSMDDNGKIQLTEIDSGVLYLKFPNPMHASPFVFVVTKDSLPNFIEKANATAKVLIDLASDFMPKLTEIAKALSPKKQTA